MLLWMAPQTGLKAGLGQTDVVTACRLQARRRWLIRAGVSLTLSSLLLVLFVCLQRDRMTVRSCLRNMERHVVALQAEVSELGQLPAELPASSSRFTLVYASDLVREYARQVQEPVIVGHSAVQPLMLGHDGHGVLIYENGTVRSEWWPRPKLLGQWQAQSLRIRDWDFRRHLTPPELP